MHATTDRVDRIASEFLRNNNNNDVLDVDDIADDDPINQREIWFDQVPRSQAIRQRREFTINPRIFEDDSELTPFSMSQKSDWYPSSQLQQDDPVDDERVFELTEEPRSSVIRPRFTDDELLDHYATWNNDPPSRQSEELDEAELEDMVDGAIDEVVNEVAEGAVQSSQPKTMKNGVSGPLIVATSYLNQRGDRWWKQKAYDDIMEQRKAKEKREKDAKRRQAQIDAQNLWASNQHVQRTIRQTQMKATMTPAERAKFDKLQKMIKHHKDVLISWNKHLNYMKSNGYTLQIKDDTYDWWKEYHAKVRRRLRKKLRELWIEMAHPSAADRNAGFNPSAMTLWYLSNGENIEQDLADSNYIMMNDVDNMIDSYRNRITQYRRGILANVNLLDPNDFFPRVG